MKTLKIIKIGGNIIDNDLVLTSFLKEFSILPGPKILVHGGGKVATVLANKMNVQVKMIDGRRVTDKDTLEIITMVYAGKINKKIVAKLQSFGCNSVGLMGADGNTIISNKRAVSTIDFGFVGDVVKVNVNVPNMLIDNGIVSVFSAITHDERGQLLNTNADTIAAELSIAFASMYNVELYYCFEKKGVLIDVSNDSSVIKLIDQQKYQNLKDKGIIDKGMIPKLENCFYALENNVSKVCVGKSHMIFDSNSTFTTIQN